MGSEYNESDFPEISMAVGGTNTLESIEVMKYSSGWKCIHTESPAQLTCTFAYTDTDFTEDSLYYVRVIRTDGEMAWSSPVWAGR